MDINRNTKSKIPRYQQQNNHNLSSHGLIDLLYEDSEHSNLIQLDDDQQDEHKIMDTPYFPGSANDFFTPEGGLMEDKQKDLQNSLRDINSMRSSFQYDTDLNKVEDGDDSNYLWNVFTQFDCSFLIVISICNFAQGFRRLLELGLYYVFKDKLGLQPAEITLLLGIMAFPWVAKIFLAIFSDNVTCCGSRRKSYLIINSAINVISIILLMLFGIRYGKYFIMFCIITSQVCMTWCDAISDALIAQASRIDFNKGAANLNSLTMLAFALGGIIACVSAGCIELDDGKDVDPNWYFGTYAGLIFMLFIAAIFLNKKLEPEIILQHRIRMEYLRRRQEQMDRIIADGIQLEEDDGESQDAFVQETLCESFGRTFTQIGKLMKHKEFSISLLFFLIQGILIPNFDDLQYVFLTDADGQVRMPKYEYDFLNTITYVAIVIFICTYNFFLTKVQVWIMVLISLIIFLFMTSLMLINALRLNLEYGVSDEAINAVIFFFGTQSVSTLAFIPMQVVLTTLVPENIEASTMALISGTFIWSYEVGAKISASLYCIIFQVDDEHMENYPRILIAKMIMLLPMMVLTLMIPNNEEILTLAKTFRKEHRDSKEQLAMKKIRRNYLHLLRDTPDDDPADTPENKEDMDMMNEMMMETPEDMMAMMM